MRSFAVALFAVVCGLILGFGCGPSPDQFVLPATATVNGQILEKTTTPPNPLGVAAARITLEAANNAPVKGFLGPFFANGSGAYLIPNIPAGIYDLVGDKSVGTPAQPLRGRVRFLNLREGESRVVPDLILRPPGTISGVVRLQGAPATGNAGVSVFLEGTTRITSSDAGGAYTLVDLESGQYSIVFQKPGFIDDTRHSVEVVSGQATQVSTTLAPLSPQSTAALIGRVIVEPRDATTGDHSGVTVTVEGTSRSLVTTPGGYFRFDALPLSLYAVRFDKLDAFTRRIPNILLQAGEIVHDLGTIQVDTHRMLAGGLKAFDLEHSPNGTQVAFTNSAGEVGVMDRNGNVFSQVLTQGAAAAYDPQTGRGRGLSWSPDGTEILFVRFEGFPTLPYRIGIVPSSGGAFRTLLTSGNEYYQPAWSPDGRGFNYYLTPNIRRVDVSRDDLGRTTWVASTDRIISGNQPPGAVTVVSSIEAAATGRVVYSFATTANSNGIFSAFALGGVDPIQVRPITPGGQGLDGADSPTFSPGASRIAFSFRSTDATLKGIYLMNLDGSGATRITTAVGNNLDFSPDGRRILYTNPDIGTPHLGEINEVLVPR